jgi:hypothetical protein
MYLQMPPALVDELVAAWRTGAKPMFSDPIHVSWRGALQSFLARSPQTKAIAKWEHSWYSDRSAS